MHRRRFIATTSSASLLSASPLAAAAAEPTPKWPADLSAHRIARVDSRSSQDRYARSLGPNAKRGPHGQGYARRLATITTDQGATGMGICWPPPEKLEPFIGAKISDLFDLVTGTTTEAAILDYVLHDLVGVIRQQPVYQLLGAKGPSAVDIYSGAIYMDDLMPKDRPEGVKAVLDACQMDHDAGYRAFKLKVGRGAKWMPRKEGVQRDIEVTRAVRERFPDSKILVDANDGFTLDDAKAYVSGVADCNLFWIEEPFPEERENLLRLREHMRRVDCLAYLADGETRHGSAPEPWEWGEYTREHIETFFSLAEEDLLDVCVFNIGTLGFSRWRRNMPVFKEAGVLAAPHLWGCTPKPFYAAHLAAGVGNVLIVEGIPGVGQHLDYSQYKLVDGKLRIPDVPGFGLGSKDGPGVGL